MPASYLPYEPEQDFLLPPSLSEWLPEGHLAYFISDSVDALDLLAFHARYEAGGPRNQPFHPAMMVKVLLYAYATGVFSSRKISPRSCTRTWRFGCWPRATSRRGARFATSGRSTLKAEAQLKEQNAELLKRAQAADQAEKNERQLQPRRRFKDRDGGSPWSEIKEDERAKRARGDIRGRGYPRPGPGRGINFCRPGS